MLQVVHRGHTKNAAEQFRANDDVLHLKSDTTNMFFARCMSVITTHNNKDIYRLYTLILSGNCNV